MTSSLSWTRTSSHRPEGLQEPKAIDKRASRFEQVAEKRQACDVAKNDTNLQKLVKKSLEIQVEEKQVAEIKEQGSDGEDFT